MHRSLTWRELLGSGAMLALAAPVSLPAVLQGKLPGPLQTLLPQDARGALRLLGFAGQSDWSLPRMLHRLEAYNGFGYRRSGRSSPYLWSFSNLFTSGKFVADGRFDPKAKSQQCGAAVMLKLLDLAGELS